MSDNQVLLTSTNTRLHSKRKTAEKVRVSPRRDHAPRVAAVRERATVIETNLRIVQGGADLELPTRIVEVRVKQAGQYDTADLLEKACVKLRHDCRLSAVRRHDGSLAVLSQSSIADFAFKGDDWEVELHDVDEPRLLSLRQSRDVEPMLRLLGRGLHLEIERRTNRWNFNSRRKWHNAEPFKTEDSIRAYNRVSVGTLHLEGVGAAVSADMETAYFAEHTLDWFLEAGVGAKEQFNRREWLDRLTARNEGRKGTFIYFNGKTIMPCYLEKIPQGVTCATTGEITVKGTRYSSLLEYYRVKFPNLPVQAETPAVLVSFSLMNGGAVYVAATCLRASVPNNHLSSRLNNEAMLSPADRHRYINEFWDELEDHPLGTLAPDLQAGFWRPDESRIWRIPHPKLEFARNRVLAAPAPEKPAQIKENYRQRMKMLEGGGCHHFPPATSRTLPCLYPRSVNAATAERLGKDVCLLLSEYTGADITPSCHAYNRLEDGINHLKNRRESGVALWVMDREPHSYYEIEIQLANWRPKRVTQQTLGKKWSALQHDNKNGGRGSRSGERSWESFVTMTALDVLQKMDALPYRIAEVAPYDAMLVIDVHHDRRFFALSLWVARGGSGKPDILETQVRQKADNRETINECYLGGELSKFLALIWERYRIPLKSLLVLRDGKWCGDERATVESTVKSAIDSGFVLPDAPIDLAEFYKKSNKEVRLWQKDEEQGTISNVSEGTAVQLSERAAVLCNTGESSLNDRTAKPMMLQSEGDFDLEKAARMSFFGAQLNFASPSVAQRLPLPFKRTDEELEARSQQEVRKNR